MEKNIDKTYVALLDILGFKELAYNNKHEELIKVYNTFETATKTALALFKMKFEKDKFYADTSSIKINSITISDSIILWTDNLGYNNFFNLLLTVRAILSEGMRCGIPMRGAMVVGPITIKEEKLESNTQNMKMTCFGKSIVDAYILSEKQNWSGCYITKESIDEYESAVQYFKTNQDKYNNERIDNALLLSSLERKFLLRKYLVPFKDGELTEEVVINWVNELTPKWSEHSIRNSFSKYNKPTNNWAVETKIRNTIAFANDCPDSPIRK